MKRLWRGKNPGKVCIPIVETTVKKALDAIKEAGQTADLIELRMDYLRKPELGPLMNSAQKPFIVTNRPKEERGRFSGDERTRLRILEEAIDLGAEYVDVEIGTKRAWLQDFIANKKGTRMILSFHDFQGTPSQKELRRLYERMARLGPDLVKIVTFAKSWEDNLLILSLLPYARKKRQEIVAFCMGEKGKMSRIFAPWMGAAWTYASLKKDRVSAPGQLTIQELKGIWERLR